MMWLVFLWLSKLSFKVMRHYFCFKRNRMAHKIVFNISAKVFNMPDCVKLPINKNYVDTIIKGKNYNGESQLAISITNLCSAVFEVNRMVLFTDNDNGGNFEARLDPFTISGNQTLNIPLKYYGISQSDSAYKDFLVRINGSSANIRLNITQPKTTHPPTIQTVEITLDNRENYTFKLSDFTQKYGDLDGHELDAILLEGDVSRFRLNGQPISSPAEITAYDIRTERLSYVAEDTDQESITTVTLRVKDSSGEISVI